MATTCQTRLVALGLSAAALSIVSAVAQTSPPTRPPTASPPTNDGDILVEGVRDIDPQSLATRRTLNTNRTGNQQVSRQNYDISDRFARCSIKVGMSNMRLLHLALDSVTNSVRQDNAQRRFIEGNAGCAADSALAGMKGQTTTTGTRDTNDSDDPQLYYDRGAMFVRAVQAFAPRLQLTKAQLDNPTVQARFYVREEPLARFRLPQDRQFLGVAICVVHYQPALSIRLVMKDLPLSARENIAAAIVNRSRNCFGNAKKVYFDTSQFRFYVADALYRWTVAVRNVNSLVPGWEDK